ncbi:hypothetical protein [Thermococcus sp.]|uniref:hypothetical protein n=1 Tax=Thermococcus sp. TaxID=35749 RepID=UPI0026338F37|nr:hypothetical protein [Thermococcus sp.]
MVSRKWMATWLVLNFLIFWFVGLTSSGYSMEGYLPGQSEKVERYIPIVYARPDDMPMGILYMVDYDGTIHYYIVWEDEYFSNSLIDKLYRFFRGLVYGGATQDIEVVKVNPSEGTFYFQTHGHTDVHGKILPDGSCLWLEKNLVIPNCTENETHIRVYVVTWNHMLSLLPEDGTVRARLKIRHMTPDDYVALGMFRRTQYSMAGITFNSLTLAVLSTIAFNGVFYWAWRRGYLTREGQKRVMDELRKSLGRKNKE